MITFLTRNWWIQTIRGILALTFGITALVAPSTSVAVAALLVAAFAVADGAMTLTSGLAQHREHRGWTAASALGAVCIGIGLMVAFWPAITPTVLTMLFAAWCVASGALLVVGASHLRPAITNTWIMTAVGAVTAATGIALAVAGPTTVDGFLTFAGGFGIVVGAALLLVSVRLRRDSEVLIASPEAVVATDPHGPAAGGHHREPALQS